MALYRLVVRYNMASGGDADVGTWSHGVSLTTLPTAAQLVTLWETAVSATTYGSALRGVLAAWVQRKSVELAPAAGGASVLFGAHTGQFGFGSLPLAPQIAVPLIAMVGGDRGPRAGARWMIGPLAGGTDNGRPTVTQKAAVVAYARSLHALLQPYGPGLVVLRNDGLTSDPVAAFSVSNAYGMVGRRRLEVTARTLTNL